MERRLIGIAPSFYQLGRRVRQSERAATLFSQRQSIYNYCKCNNLCHSTGWGAVALDDFPSDRPRNMIYSLERDILLVAQHCSVAMSLWLANLTGCKLIMLINGGLALLGNSSIISSGKGFQRHCNDGRLGELITNKLRAARAFPWKWGRQNIIRIVIHIAVCCCWPHSFIRWLSDYPHLSQSRIYTYSPIAVLQIEMDR